MKTIARNFVGQYNANVDAILANKALRLPLAIMAVLLIGGLPLAVNFAIAGDTGSMIAALMPAFTIVAYWSPLTQQARNLKMPKRMVGMFGMAYALATLASCTLASGTMLKSDNLYAIIAAFVLIFCNPIGRIVLGIVKLAYDQSASPAPASATVTYVGQVREAMIGGKITRI